MPARGRPRRTPGTRRARVPGASQHQQTGRVASSSTSSSPQLGQQPSSNSSRLCFISTTGTVGRDAAGASGERARSPPLSTSPRSSSSRSRASRIFRRARLDQTMGVNAILRRVRVTRVGGDERSWVPVSVHVKEYAPGHHPAINADPSSGSPNQCRVFVCFRLRQQTALNRQITSSWIRSPDLA